MRQLLAFTLTALTLSACGSLPDLAAPVPAPLPATSDQGAAPPVAPLPTPRIVASAEWLECVPYARARSGVALRGNAHTWWQAAAGRYPRDSQPRVGAVLVLKRRGGSQGHLAVVRAVVSDREVIVDHANWLNQGRIHLATPVRDVSAAGDWSRVRVWYTPGGHLGTGVYPAHGFILPPTVAQTQAPATS